MSSDADFVDHVLDQLAGLPVASRKMFGEYAVYLGGKVVALVCDNRVYVKPTAAGRAVASGCEEAPPYPGAKPHLLVDDRIEDAAWLRALMLATADALPMPKAKPRPKPSSTKPVRPTKPAKPTKPTKPA